ncbi:MAG: hypothetical protein JNK82_03895 [Myxococcaceae bacterium]|nr:hypothetical protein [Myxococcaceae bacterium]
MSARTLTQLAVLLLGAVALALGGVLVSRELKGSSVAGPVDAGACADLDVAPKPVSPLTEGVALIIWPGPGVKVQLDGKPVVSLPEAPQSFFAGPHQLVVECDGPPRGLDFTLQPFTPGAVFAGCDALFVVGLVCDDCPETSAARKTAAKAGRDSGPFIAAAAQEKLELQEHQRARSVLTQRWNTLTERYSRVLQVVGREAPGPVAAANQRFEELSLGFRRAATNDDPVAQDLSIRTAEATLKVFVRASRLARPDDCAFQRRLTAAF